jgi:hypothetical protein
MDVPGRLLLVLELLLAHLGLDAHPHIARTAASLMVK